MDVVMDVVLMGLLIFPIVMYGKMLFTSLTTSIAQRKIEKKHILYVIAHPDDEAMYAF